jgi:putative ABC transport system permease protein
LAPFCRQRLKGVRDVRRSLRSWLWRVPVDEEVDEEIAFHLEMRTRELVERGIDQATARELAAAKLGDVARLKRTCVDLGRKRDREMRLTQWLDELRADVSFAMRQLRRAPAFTLVAALTLALGIGANSAIFALVDAALLRPLPFPEPDRLVMVSERTQTTERARVSPPNLIDWNERSRTVDEVAGFVPSVGGMVMNGVDGTAETVSRQWVTAGFFDVLGIRPVVGRTFLPSDDSQRANAVVLGEAFWRARFNADPSVVGRDIRLDGMQFTVVGVVPKEFQWTGRSAIWALMALDRRPQLRGVYILQGIGRLKPGVSLEAANVDMTGVSEDLAREFPATNTGRGVRLEPLREALIGGELRLTSILFLGVVAFVLLICCANVANLLLARATVRTRELAVRSALGAGRRRIVRQLLTEGLVLSAIGAALGAGIGAAILSIAPSVMPPGLLPEPVTLRFDNRVAAFCWLAALLVGALFGLAPAWHATDFSSAQALASDSRGATGRGGGLRSLFVAGEVASAVVLLFGAGLLLRTLMVVNGVDRGYRAESVLTMMVDPLASSYPSAASLQQFFDAVEGQIRTLPGVRSVAWSNALPMGPSDGGRFSFEIVGDPPVDENRRPTADSQIASATYFGALELPIVAGRAFDDGDTRDSTPVCIVNEAFVRGALRGRPPIGLRVALRAAGSPQAPPLVREIVGVARQVKARPDETEEAAQVYMPMAQNLVDDIYLVVRPASGAAEALAPSVRAAIGRVDKEQLVSVRNVMTLDDIAREATARHRFRAVMVMTFAALALLLAMIGVFGILAYSVQQRVRDVAVRRALGAGTRDVLRLVAGGTVRVVAAGAVVGLMLAAALGMWLETVLFGVRPLDPLTFALVAFVLGASAAMAIAAPAWRAARIDPAVALRNL